MCSDPVSQNASVCLGEEGEVGEEREGSPAVTTVTAGLNTCAAFSGRWFSAGSSSSPARCVSSSAPLLLSCSPISSLSLSVQLSPSPRRDTPDLTLSRSPLPVCLPPDQRRAVPSSILVLPIRSSGAYLIRDVQQLTSGQLETLENKNKGTG